MLGISTGQFLTLSFVYGFDIEGFRRILYAVMGFTTYLMFWIWSNRVLQRSDVDELFKHKRPGKPLIEWGALAGAILLAYGISFVLPGERQNREQPGETRNLAPLSNPIYLVTQTYWDANSIRPFVRLHSDLPHAKAARAAKEGSTTLF
ncbi:MAG: hypothetical protein H7Y43_01930 [Akkermansiaceae bacterium]|nr:hypothetical protein [Verrucomicrobiales bacterium]